MTKFRSQSVFPMSTNQPRDVVTNVMHWDSPTDLFDKAAAADAIATRLSAFYDTIYSGAGYSANYINWALSRVEVFDIAEPIPRVPEVRDLVLTLSPTATIVPSEVAVVLSYHSAPESGTPRQRLHNRIYLGGLGSSAIATSSGATPIVAGSFRDMIASAADTLFAANTPSLAWVQRSSTPTVTDRAIVGGWIDNEPDTQRRRGQGPTTRTSWVA